jgi:hypothetical protein
MYLPEDDSEAFDSFIVFIYRDTLPKFVADKDPLIKEDVGWHAMEKLAPLFYLAEKYCMKELANKVMDAFQDLQLRHQTIPNVSLMTEIYNNTRDRSKLPQYGTLCALYCTMTDTSGEDWSEDAADYTELAATLSEFATDYIMLLRKHRALLPYKDPAEPQIRNNEGGFGKFYFHTHRKGEKCHLDEDE